MTKALQRIRSFVQRIVALFRPRRTLPRVEPLALKEEPAAASAPAVEAVAAPPAPTPAAPPAEDAPKLNRKLRRQMSAYERARRKHDIFVDPKGTPPEKKTREKIERERDETPVDPTPIEYVKTEEFYVADKHHRDPDGADVLYKESEFYGEYNFRDTILEQLERYFVYLKRMKERDPDSYGFYRQVGAHIVPYEMGGCARALMRVKKGLPDKEREDYSKKPELPPFFKKHRPSFGCFAFGANPVTEEYETLSSDKEETRRAGKWIMVPKFMYFTKYTNPPPEVQPMSGGDVYKMTVWWDRAQDAEAVKKYKGGRPQEYAIFISADGSKLEVLRTVETKRIDVLIKKKRRDSSGRISFYHQIPQRLWRIPDCYEDWAANHGTDAQHFLQHVFCDCAHVMETVNYSMIRVAATKGDMTAVFSVNVRRMAYFFKDRDFQLNKNGARKPIFHIVRAHERHTKNGKTYYMPFSFRGEKEFTWAGYDISITVPGRDHFMLPEVNIGVSDEYWQTKDDKWVNEEEFGRELVQWMKEGRVTRKENIDD